MERENRLAGEKSPYLLQHARNPVDWYPWGDEAAEKARREDKPIFLSIGYSTCHWCHVMERESFENEEIAALLNRDFVAVKVDREERPDVDKIYMTAVQALTGQGGWPLSAFLTPELKPFYGGTYFPPTPRYGQPGFAALLSRIAQLWKERRAELASDAGKLAQALSQSAAAPPAPEAPQKEWLERAARGYVASVDPDNGGFGGAPKFPMPANQAFLLRWHAMTGDQAALDAALGALRAMAAGGIRDHLGGGFHRYSTDAQWRVPHFEKMLYDNAQLAVNFLEAGQALGRREFEPVARQVLDYVLRDLALPEGGFACAEDADSPAPGGGKAEGAFYLWTMEELSQTLGAGAEAFARAYGVEEGGNAVFDPHGELSGKNVLYEADAELAAGLGEERAKLLALRAERPRPDRDDKALSAWNGLTISALAKGWQVLEEPRYLEAARRCAGFLEDQLYDAASGRLWRSWRAGARGSAGTADDYAFLAQGLLDLYEADFDDQWLSWALALAKRLREGFEAPEGGFYLTSAAQDGKLLIRVMDDTDNVEPCASSAAAMSLLRLFELTGDSSWRESADRALARFGAAMRERPQSVPYMLCAAAFRLSKPQEIVIAGRRDADDTRALLREARRRLAPARTIALADEGAASSLMPWTKDMKADGKARAYVCRGFACERPVTTAEELSKLLS